MMRNNVGMPLEAVESTYADRLMPRLIYLTWVAYLAVIIYSIIWNDRKALVVILISSILLIIPFWLYRLGHFQISNFLFVFILLANLTLLATFGQGIHDMSIMAYPVILIFACLAMNRFGFYMSVLLIFVSIGWLVFGESSGLFVSKTYETPHFHEFIIVAIILLVGTLTVNLLSKTLRRNLTLAHSELVRREQAEQILREAYEKILKANKNMQISTKSMNLCCPR